MLADELLQELYSKEQSEKQKKQKNKEKKSKSKLTKAAEKLGLTVEQYELQKAKEDELKKQQLIDAEQ